MLALLGVDARAQDDSYSAFAAHVQGASNFYYHRYDSVTETYTQLIYNASASRWQRSTTPDVQYPQIGQTWMSPGGEDSPEEVVRSWRAPASGSARISLSAIANGNISFTTPALTEAGDDGVRLSVRRNRLALWSATMPRTLTQVAFSPITIQVNSGDELYFHVDRWSSGYNDWVQFLPVVTLTTGSGYTDPAVTYDSGTGFGTSTGPWYYLAVPQGQGGRFNPASPSPYIPMVYQNQTPPYWAWVSGMTVQWARVYATQQHPETNYDSVRAWIAPSAGDVYLDTVIPIAMAYVQALPADGAVVSIHHNDAIVWSKALDRTDTTGEMLKRRLHVLAGDSITFRVSAGPSQIAYGDHVNLQVTLKHVPGEDSVGSFAGTTGGNWQYRARNLSTGAYSAMVYNPSTFAWESGTVNVARVYADRQVPAPGIAAVRTWRAPVDCVAHVNTRVFAKQTSNPISGEDGVNVSVLRDSEVMLTERVAGDNLTGVPLTVRVPMRMGQLLDIAVDDGVSGGITGDDVTLAYTVTPYVNGGPRRQDGPVIDVYSPIDIVPAQFDVDQPTLWSWGTYKVHASLNLNTGGVLDLRDAVLEFQNTFQREFNLNWRGGLLATAGSLTGGRLDANSVMLHSNFELSKGTWYCTDSMLRYHYGVLPGDPYSQPMTTGAFRGTRVVRGPSCGELILRGPGSSKLVDSTMMVNLNSSLAGTPQPGGYSFNFLIDRPIAAETLGTTGTIIPGALYDLRIENSLVPWWWYFPTGIATFPPPSTPPWVFRFQPSRPSALLPNVMANDLRGGYRLPLMDGTSTTPLPVTVGNCQQEFTQTRVLVWGAYFNGANTNAVMLGAQNGAAPYDVSHIGEFMVFDGRAQFRSTSATQRDALSGATTMEIGGAWSGAPAVKVVLKWVKIGTPWTRGQISVNAGSTLIMEDCDVSNVDIIVNSGTVLDRRSTWTGVNWSGGSPTPDTGYEAVHRWDFTLSREGWENWGQNIGPWYEQGFSEPWNTFSGALRLNYPTIPVGGWTPQGGTPTAANPVFNPRMVIPGASLAPSNVKPLYAMNLEHCYLVLRVNPQVSNTSTPLRVVVTATDNEAGWPSWSLYERQFDIAATTGWATYIVDLNSAPGTTQGPRVTPHMGPGSQPYSGRTNYLGVQFGTSAQNGYLNAPDRIDVDYVVITDDYTPY